MIVDVIDNLLALNDALTDYFAALDNGEYTDSYANRKEKINDAINMYLYNNLPRDGKVGIDAEYDQAFCALYDALKNVRKDIVEQMLNDIMGK